jgi:hypothetical protein
LHFLQQRQNDLQQPADQAVIGLESILGRSQV